MNRNLRFFDNVADVNRNINQEGVLNQEINPNREIVVFDRELLQEQKDRLEQVCNNLDNTSTSFAESFPNYDPNDGIYFIKLFSNVVDWFKNTKVGKAEIEKIKSTPLNENIEKNILDKDVILENDEMASQMSGSIVNTFKSLKELYGGNNPFGPKFNTPVVSNIQEQVVEPVKELTYNLPDFIGNLTLNQIYNFFMTFDYSVILDNTHEIQTFPFRIIPGLLIYRALTNMYVRNAYPMSHYHLLPNTQMKQIWLLERQKHLRLFMLFYGPILTFTFFKMFHSSIGDIVKIKAIINKDNSDESIANSIFSFLFFLNKNKNKNEKKENKYIKILKRVLISLFILLFLDFNTILNFILKISYSDLVLFTLIIDFIYIIYKLIEIYIFVLIIRNKIKTPNYLPLFLSKWLKTREEISNSEPKVIGIFMDLYIKDIISHITLFIFFSIIYIFFL